MNTVDLIEAIREDIRSGLRDEIMNELQAEIQRRLHANIFTFREALKYLKVSESTLRRMVANDEVPHFMQRGNLYFRQIDLDRHIETLIRQKKKPS